MTNIEKSEKKRSFDFTDNKYRGTRYVWEIRVDGKPDSDPIGYVKADAEFGAYYSAFDKGITPLWNYPFGIEVRKASRFIRDI